MGDDKAFLELHGKTLLHRALELAGSVAEHVAIVGSPDKFSSFGSVVADLYADRGPLAGLYSAIASTQTELNLILAVDLPLLTPDFLQQLRSLAERESALAVVPRVGGRFQPLCAFYRKPIADEAQHLLLAGMNKLEVLLETITPRVVEEDEVQRLGGTPEMFLNVNNPEDFRHAMHLIQQK